MLDSFYLHMGSPIGAGAFFCTEALLFEPDASCLCKGACCPCQGLLFLKKVPECLFHSSGVTVPPQLRVSGDSLLPLPLWCRRH